MGYLSDFLEGELLDHLLGTAAWSAPAAVYVGLFTAAPGEAGGGTEVSGGDYAREEVAFDAASGGLALSTALETFGPSTAAWGTVTHWGLFDALTAGNLLVYGPLQAVTALGSTDTQFDVTNPDGLIFRYTYDSTGTDPALAADNPDPGDMMLIDGDNFSAGNNGLFLVVASGANYFEVINPAGVAEENKTLGATGSLKRYAATSKAIGSGESLDIPAGGLIVSLQ